MKTFAVLAALAAFAPGVAPASAGFRVEPEVQAATAAPERAPRAAPSRITRVTLPVAVLPKVSEAGTPRQVGFARDVPAPGAALAWEPSTGGTSIAALRITSPGAAAVRLALVVDALPPGTRITLQGQEASPFEVAAGGIPLGEPWWAPVVEGDSALLVLEVPAGEDPAALRLAVPRLSHLVASASTGFAAKSASLCHLDVRCEAAWTPESKSVARLVFTTSGGTSFTCSGVLLADRDGATTIPYLLTARHCIGTAASAASIQPYWFYRSTACDSGALDPAYETTPGGATLLYSSSLTDSTLVRLNATPPAGAIYAGWIAGTGTLGEGVAVTGIHHPAGDMQKASHGEIRGHYTCAPSPFDPMALDCDPTLPASSTFYAIGWTGGTVEGGSSGGGIFRDDGHYLLGQIYGGNGSCTTPAFTFAGRFDVAYDQGLSRWLGPPEASGATSHAAEAAPLYDVSDLWWNAAESGWGLSLTQHGSTVFGAWFAYDAQGQPRWVVMPGGTWTDERTFTGEVYATTGPDGLQAFDPARVVRTRVGVATIAFSAADRAVLTYTVDGASGTKAITRQPFGPVNSVASGVYGDLWWNAAESGWGLSVSQQHGTLFAVWYTYGADGKPTWYVMPGGTWISAEGYRGTLYRTSDAAAPFFGGTFDPATVTRTPVGSMTLTFTSAGTGTMAYEVDGASGTRPIARQPF